MALTPFDMEGVNRDLLAAGNPAKPDMQSILRRNARDLVLGNAILVSSVDAKELEFGVHMAYSDADGGFDTDPSEDVWFEASSLPIPNERPDLPPDNALRIRVTDVLTEYGFTDIDVKAPDRTPEGIWIGFEAMQPVRLDVTSAQEGRSVSFTLTAAEANDWRSGRLDAHGLSRMAVERVLARPGDTVTLAYGDSLFRPAVMCDGSGRLPEHRVKAGIGTFVIGRESEAVMPEILRIDRTVDPRDPLVIEKAFGKENDMENGNVPEYWKGLMDEADLPLAGIVREHGGGLMDFHRMKGIERLTGSSDWDFYSWTVENYDDDLLDVCERENAADVLADLQAWWKTSQPDMRQHVDEMMAGIDAAMEPLDKRLYAAAEKEFKERALDPDGECYQLDGGTFISQESFDGICGDQRDRYMAWKNQAEPARLVSAWDDPARLDRLVGDLIDADDGGGCFYTDAQPIDYTQGMDYSPQQLAADSGLGDTVPLACESNASYSLAHHPDIKFTATGSPDGRKALEVSAPGSARHALITAKPGTFDAAGRHYDGGKESVDRFWNDLKTDRGLAVEPRYVELAFGCPPIEWDIDARVRDFAERMGDEYTSLYEQDTTSIKGGDFERFGAFADNHLDFIRALTKARGMDPISSDREIGAFLNTFDKLAAMPEPTPAKQEKDELSAGACDPADPLNLEQSSSYGMTR